MEIVNNLPENNKVDPTEFNVTIKALLTGLGAEKYVDIFRKRNIGQFTLAELTEEDLIKIGVDDEKMRSCILEGITNLPIYEESPLRLSRNNVNLTSIEIIEVLDESSQHLYRIYLSMLANTLALKKTKNISDSLIYKDKYASDIALETLSEITNIVNSMDVAIHTKMRELTQESHGEKTKKIVVGTVGSAVIAVLTVLFIRSLKQL